MRVIRLPLGWTIFIAWVSRKTGWSFWFDRHGRYRFGLLINRWSIRFCQRRGHGFSIDLAVVGMFVWLGILIYIAAWACAGLMRSIGGDMEFPEYPEMIPLAIFVFVLIVAAELISWRRRDKDNE